jgi:hypothetical protein
VEPASAKWVPARQLVITVPGIRTFGNWQAHLKNLLHGTDPNVDVVPYHFGYFSAIAFLIPFVRGLVVKRFAAALARYCCRDSWDRIDIVAHSFGTYIVANALARMLPEQRPKIHTLVLAGSVLKVTYPIPSRRLLRASPS